MHASDETTGHVPANIYPNAHDADLSDEALDRATGKVDFLCFSGGCGRGG